jgi:hypothetical protein
MTMQRVITSNNCSQFIIKRQKPGNKRQLWYFDNVSKTIKSRGCPGKSVSGHGWIYMKPTNSRWFQMWKYSAGSGIVHNIRNKKVFDVHGNSDTENRSIHWYRRHNKAN